MSSSRTRVARLRRAVALRWAVGLSLVGTVLLFALLSVQMSLGRDPSLGPKLSGRNASSQASQSGSSQAASTPAPAPVAPAPVPQPAPVQTTTS